MGGALQSPASEVTLPLPAHAGHGGSGAPPALEGRAVKLLLLKGRLSRCLWAGCKTITVIFQKAFGFPQTGNV